MDFDKMNGLVPAIIQDADTAKVLMLGNWKGDFLQPYQEPSLDERRGEWQLPECGFHEGRL